METYRLDSGTKSLVVVAIALTLSTAYIHYWVGGPLLLLNAAGYLALAASVAITALAFRRALPVVLIALAAYAAVTIAGWLVMGPYFDVAYLAKGIEIALITTIALVLRQLRTETRASIAWALSLPKALRRQAAP
jgi:hypothetical protein